MPRQSKPPIGLLQFTKCRAAVHLAKGKLEEHRIAMAVKYGPGVCAAWMSRGEVTKLERLERAYDRTSDRMFKLLGASPRDWRSGVPAYWVVESLSYDDAIAPQTTPLSVTPPLAYGQTESVR